MRKAWIVVYIDTSVSPAAVRGAGVFSEPNPTALGRLRTIPYEDFDGEDYGAAAKDAERHLAMPHMGWLGPLYMTPKGLVRRASPVLPAWAKCLLLNLASVVWFASGMQAERETTITELLGYSYWREQGVWGGGMSGSVPLPSPAHWVVERGKLEATNPLYIEEGRGVSDYCLIDEVWQTNVEAP